MPFSRTRSTVRPRRPCCSLRTRCRPSTATTTRSCTLPAIWPTTGCFRNGNASPPFWPGLYSLQFRHSLIGFLGFCFVGYRVMDQHNLSREQWEERISTWHAEHTGMLRWIITRLRYRLAAREGTVPSAGRLVSTASRADQMGRFILSLYFSFSGNR